ncbi:MAG: Gfo/Idh/MocA family protein [Mycobacteriales bacterium]
MDRVRLGIAGIGNIAALNAAGYLAHEACEVVALCDPRRDKAERMAREWGVPRTYTDLADLLAAPDVDAVEILTPTYLHAGHVVAAARAGKHISVQKPVANSVAEARAMLAAVRETGVTFRVTENALHYPPLVKARELIRAGAIGTPTMVRIKTVVGATDSGFQRGLEPEGYMWRFSEQSPGGHLFDDMVHKYALAHWLVDSDIKSVQAVVRQGEAFFEAPTAALWEYDRPNLLGLMEVTHAPNMWLRSSYFGADEFFEVQGSDGFLWVTRLTGEMLDLPPLFVYHPDGTTTSYSQLDADWGHSFAAASRHFVDALLAGDTAPDMTGELAVKVLQLCFAVYQASIDRGPVDPATIEGAVSPPWWPLWRTDAASS